jgi:ferric-dicitrate binding protein FerR (iron transport regulator)
MTFDPDALISSYLDGDCSPDEVAALDRWTAASDNNADHFARRVLVHSLLPDGLLGRSALRASAAEPAPDGIRPLRLTDREHERAAAGTTTGPNAASRPAPRDDNHDAVTPAASPRAGARAAVASRRTPPLKRRWWIGLAAVVMLGAAAAALTISLVPGKPVGALRLADTFGAVWEPGPSPPTIGRPMPSGPLRLSQGSVRLNSEAGMDVIVLAPAAFEVLSPTSLRLTSGQISVRSQRVTPGAVAVETPWSSITDLGTEFAVLVARDGTTETHVTEGTVEVRPLKNASAAPVRLTAGQSAVTSSLSPSPTTIPSRLSEFRHQMRVEPSHRWTFEGDVIDSGTCGGGAPMLIGAGTYAADAKVGSRALSLDGQTGYVDAGTVALPEDFTIAGWFKTSHAGTNQDLFTAFDPALGRGAAVLVEVDAPSGHRLRLFYRWPQAIYGGTELHSPSSVNDGRWHHFMGVRRGQQLLLYLDGRLVESKRHDAAIPPQQRFRVELGRGGANNPDELRPFKGLLDDLALYPRAMTPETIR